MKTLISLPALAILFMIASPTEAAIPKKWTLKLDQGSSNVEFKAIGKPGFLKIPGKGGKVTGKIIGKGNTVSAALKVDLKAFKTGIKLRDRHMKKKYLETGKFPQATLILKNIKIPKKILKGKSTATTSFRGILKLHGQSKRVSGKIKFERKSGKILALTASMQIKVSDYKIKVPSFMGVTMADVVDIKVAIQAPLARL